MLAIADTNTRILSASCIKVLSIHTPIRLNNPRFASQHRSQIAREHNRSLQQVRIAAHLTSIS